MKNLLSLVIALFFLGSMNAQVIPAIEELDMSMSMGAKNAFVIKYDNTDTKTVEDQWEKFMKTYKAKVKKNKAKELFADDVKLPDLSSNSIDVYATVATDATGKITILTVWYDLGGAYLNSEAHPSQVVSVKNMLDQNSLRVGAVSAAVIVGNEEDTLKDLNGDLKKLEKSKEDYLQEIEEAKALIAKMEANISENDTAQEGKKGEISEQEGVLEMAQKELAKYPKMKL